MILPIVAYGSPVLRAETKEIGQDYPDLKDLIANMWETMYNAHGVGLAAPQIGLSIRLFVVDSIQLQEDEEDAPIEGIKEVFINAEVIDESGDTWPYEEGCLSIPDVREKVMRQEVLRIRYQNEQFEQKEVVLNGVNARIVQHEYDHIEGVLFVDYLKPLKKRLIKKKLDNISKGKVEHRYKMKFPR